MASTPGAQAVPLDASCWDTVFSNGLSDNRTSGQRRSRGLRLNWRNTASRFLPRYCCSRRRPFGAVKGGTGFRPNAPSRSCVRERPIASNPSRANPKPSMQMLTARAPRIAAVLLGELTHGQGIPLPRPPAAAARQRADGAACHQQHLGHPVAPQDRTRPRGPDCFDSVAPFPASHPAARALTPSTRRQVSPVTPGIP